MECWSKVHYPQQTFFSIMSQLQEKESPFAHVIYYHSINFLSLIHHTYPSQANYCQPILACMQFQMEYKHYDSMNCFPNY